MFTGLITNIGVASKIIISDNQRKSYEHGSRRIILLDSSDEDMAQLF